MVVALSIQSLADDPPVALLGLHERGRSPAQGHRSVLPVVTLRVFCLTPEWVLRSGWSSPGRSRLIEHLAERLAEAGVVAIGRAARASARPASRPLEDVVRTQYWRCRTAERHSAQVKAPCSSQVERLSGQVTHLARDYRTLDRVGHHRGCTRASDPPSDAPRPRERGRDRDRGPSRHTTPCRLPLVNGLPDTG